MISLRGYGQIEGRARNRNQPRALGAQAMAESDGSSQLSFRYVQCYRSLGSERRSDHPHRKTGQSSVSIRYVDGWRAFLLHLSVAVKLPVCCRRSPVLYWNSGGFTVLEDARVNKELYAGMHTKPQDHPVRVDGCNGGSSRSWLAGFWTVR